MLSALRTLAPLGLLLAPNVEGWRNDAHHNHAVDDYTSTICTGNTTVFDTTTVQVTHYVDVTVNCTITNTVVRYITEATTTTLHYTVSVTDTDSVTVTTTATNSTTVTNTETDSVTITNTDTDSVTITNTDTDSVTITTTDTDSVTVTNTETTTATVPATITTYTTRTIFSTTFDPCPRSCSISAETVNLYFWPTDRPHTYPSTYVHPELAYTFTSPSVYMFVPSARGINTLGAPAGPSTSSWMLALDLYDVSTIAGGGPGVSGTGGVTRQLTLGDLGTDCPQTADPTAIATMAVDPRCNPMLAAPSPVRSWAYPCNACGRFGLFDPPYAVPTITGDLVEATPVTTVTATQLVPGPTTAAATPPPPPVGVLVIEYYDADGRMLSTDAITATGLSGTVTSSVVVPAVVTPSGSGVGSGSGPASLSPTTAPPFTESSTTLESTSAPVATASATRHGARGGFGMWLISGIVVVLFWW
ncbi:hypothetical protein MFIFM68171_04744 [Madurella fahalii]|uniref:Uncharacterized protein n=1 Tax=Madurella fahalii TaxID=1157608 RepID=A0ABQ0GA41_9PEZI